MSKDEEVGPKIESLRLALRQFRIFIMKMSAYKYDQLGREVYLDKEGKTLKWPNE